MGAFVYQRKLNMKHCHDERIEYILVYSAKFRVSRIYIPHEIKLDEHFTHEDTLTRTVYTQINVVCLS